VPDSNHIGYVPLGSFLPVQCHLYGNAPVWGVKLELNVECKRYCMFSDFDSVDSTLKVLEFYLLRRVTRMKVRPPHQVDLALEGRA
jgi:hypothetical protein